MQNRIYINYLIVLSSILIFFGLFVACGSQFYRFSVDNDFEPSNRSSPTSTQQSNNAAINTVKLGIHALQGWKNLPVPVQFSGGLSPEQRAFLFAAMKTWEQAVGKKLFDMEGADLRSGDDFPDLYSSLDDNTNGYYLDQKWEKTGKPDYVLATTIWTNGATNEVITKADIRFNEKAYIIGDSLKIKSTASREVVDMQSLALHELGHLLGLSHMDSNVDSTSIMNPALYIGEGLTSRFLSKGDISRIQEIYGCSQSSCNIDTVFEEMLYHANKVVVDPITKEEFVN